MNDRIDPGNTVQQTGQQPIERSPVMATMLRALIATAVLVVGTASAQSLDFALSPGFWPDPHRVSYVSGGPVNAGNLFDKYGFPCAGWIARSADHVMTLTRPFNYLRISAESRGDITLVLYNPRTGERFCDVPANGNGRPEIVMNYMTADTWWIYVGSYWRDDMHAYDLSVSEFSARTANW